VCLWWGAAFRHNGKNVVRHEARASKGQTEASTSPIAYTKWAMSRWGVAPRGGSLGVKGLSLKGTGETRGSPPRRRAWLKGCLVCLHGFYSPADSNELHDNLFLTTPSACLCSAFCRYASNPPLAGSRPGEPSDRPAAPEDAVHLPPGEPRQRVYGEGLKKNHAWSPVSGFALNTRPCPFSSLQ
jgi:hypothetical protein